MREYEKERTGMEGKHEEGEGEMSLAQEDGYERRRGKRRTSAAGIREKGREEE